MEDMDFGESISLDSTPRIEPTETAKVASTKKIENDSEEKTKLKRDIESIASLIDDKEQKISKNKNKWYYKHFKKLVIVLGISVLGFAISILSSFFLFSFFAASNIYLIMMALSLCFAAAGISSDIFASKVVNHISVENNSLQTDIKYLREIKKQKIVELESHTKLQNNDMISPSKTRSKIEIYQEVLKIIQSMTDTPSPEMIEEVRQVVEEIEEHSKQKTLMNP